jgi:hypothetical protein
MGTEFNRTQSGKPFAHGLDLFRREVHGGVSVLQQDLNGIKGNYARFIF